MKRTLLYRIGIPILVGISALQNSSGATVNLPPDAALPIASASGPGFVVRTSQASTNFSVGNNLTRAIKQLAGNLTDGTGTLITNVALAGPDTGGAYFKDSVNFEKDAAPIDIPDPNDPLTILVSFSPELFPGIPGEEGETTQFAVESIALIQLPAGESTLAISANADRTDTNDDDGYSVYVGANPRDVFAVKIAEFDRAGAQAFVSNQPRENQIVVNAPTAGVYPFRIVYWQTGRGANHQFYHVNTGTSERVLINDPNNTASPRAFRNSTNDKFNAPYINQISPVPGSSGVSSSAPIEVILFDGSPTTVDNASIQLSLNNSVVPATKSKSGTMTKVAFSPDAGRPDANNTVKLVFKDSNGVTYSNQWSFTIITAGGSATTVTGQWDFDQGGLGATVGKALAYFDPTFDGPTGNSGNKTTFGTCSSYSIATINGQDAKVMRVPGDLDRRIGYVMDHGIAPNGGGTKVNQYTLILDVFVEASGAGAASLLQVDSLNNTTDGDLFWQGNNFGQGTDGYKGKGTFTAGEWHRVVAAYDEAANPPVVTKYVDGIKQDDWTANQGLDAARRALLPTAILFGDGDQDERRTMWVNSIQIRSGKLSDAEMVALGGPDADGIPASIPQSTVTGQWDFNFSDLTASVGKDLQYFDPTFDGPSGSSANKSEFGICSAMGVDPIAGVDAQIMKVPGDLDRRIGYVMTHGIAPNGGGTKVNQYTLVMDVLVEASGAGAASLLQVDSVNNTTDGDLFWQGNNFGQGTDGYKGKGTFTAGKWHRVVAAYDEAATPPVVTKYVDGIKQDDWTANQGLDAARRALLPTAILFGDGDQDERRTMWVNSIQIRAGKLSDAQCALLGAPDGNAIPVALPTSTVTGQWDFDLMDLSAGVGADLQYFDPTFDGPNGSSGNKTAFGSCTELGVALISGVDAKIVQVPGDLDRKIGYVMTHRIAPNGGGTKVNQYTLILDVLIDTTGAGAASLLQVDSVDNTSDGDLFWQGNNFGQGTDGYKGTGAFTAGEWHRVAAAYNMAANPPVVTKYVDGIFQDDWTANQALDAARRALLPTAILFGDGDQDERRMMWVNSIQIRSGALSKPELEALGKPTGNPIPLTLSVEAPPTPPSLTVTQSGNQLTITWPADATGYILESSTSMASGSWLPVQGVVGNSVTVTIGSGNSFYRLKQ